MNKSSIRRFIFEHFRRPAQDMVSNLLVSIAPCWLVDWRQALLTFLIKKSFIFTISGASVEKLPFGDNAWCSSGVITKRSRTCWPEHRKIRTSWPEHEKACK